VRGDTGVARALPFSLPLMCRGMASVVSRPGNLFIVGSPFCIYISAIACRHFAACLRLVAQLIVQSVRARVYMRNSVPKMRADGIKLCGTSDDIPTGDSRRPHGQEFGLQVCFLVGRRLGGTSLGIGYRPVCWGSEPSRSGRSGDTTCPYGVPSIRRT